MKLLLQNGALDGETVVTGQDDEGVIKCTINVFMKASAGKQRLFVSSEDVKHTNRMARLIRDSAEHGQWGETGMAGELERWALDWLDIG